MKKTFFAALVAAAVAYCVAPSRNADATVLTQTSSVTYTASGGAGTFAVPYFVRNASDLVVTDNGTVKTLATHYTVSCAGCQSGAAVVFSVNPTAGHAIVIKRVPPLVQDFNARSQGQFKPASYESAYDNLETQIQLLQQQIYTVISSDGGTALNLYDEGSLQGSASSINCVGDAITCSVAAGAGTVTNSAPIITKSYNWTSETFAPDAGNTTAVTATGHGTGKGAVFVGGSGGSAAGALGTGSGGAPGLAGVGGAGGGDGIDGTAVLAGWGVWGTGGTTGIGVVGNGGSVSGDGVQGSATSGNGGTFTGGTAGNGIAATGAGAGAGVSATGGTTSGSGVLGTGGAPNGVGVIGTGTGTAPGVTATGGGSSTTDIAANKIDSRTATTMTIGATTATDIVVGASAVAPSFPGGLTVAAGKAVDTTSAGGLNIGTTNATFVNIGGVGVQVQAGGGYTAGNGNYDTGGGGALNIGPAFATSVVIAPATTIGGGLHSVTLSTGAAATTLRSTAASAGAGLRNANTRNVARTTNAAPPDCAAATLTLTVTQFLDIGIATCGTAQTINFPTWQGASGIVQGLPGTPAVGDIVGPIGLVATAGSALTPGFGTGGTNGGGTATVAANTTRWFYCRLTSVTNNSETATCY